MIRTRCVSRVVDRAVAPRRRVNLCSRKDQVLLCAARESRSLRHSSAAFGRADNVRQDDERECDMRPGIQTQRRLRTDRGGEGLEREPERAAWSPGGEANTLQKHGRWRNRVCLRLPPVTNHQIPRLLAEPMASRHDSHSAKRAVAAARGAGAGHSPQEKRCPSAGGTGSRWWPAQNAPRPARLLVRRCLARLERKA